MPCGIHLNLFNFYFYVVVIFVTLSRSSCFFWTVVFEIAIKGGGIPPMVRTRNFAEGRDFLPGGGNLRNDFDHLNLFQS